MVIFRGQQLNVQLEVSDKWCPLRGLYEDQYHLISSSVTTVRLAALSADLLTNTKMSSAVDMPDGCDGIQKDLDELKKWEPHELQQGQVQGPAPRLWQTPLPIQAGGQRD